MKISKFLSLFFCSGAISVSHLAIARGWIDRQRFTVKTHKSRFRLFSAETNIPRSQIKMTLFSNLRRNLNRFKRQRTPRYWCFEFIIFRTTVIKYNNTVFITKKLIRFFSVILLVSNILKHWKHLIIAYFLFISSLL